MTAAISLVHGTKLVAVLALNEGLMIATSLSELRSRVIQESRQSKMVKIQLLKPFENSWTSLHSLENEPSAAQTNILTAPAKKGDTAKLVPLKNNGDGIYSPRMSRVTDRQAADISSAWPSATSNNTADVPEVAPRPASKMSNMHKNEPVATHQGPIMSSLTHSTSTSSINSMTKEINAKRSNQIVIESTSKTGTSKLEKMLGVQLSMPSLGDSGTLVVESTKKVGTSKIEQLLGIQLGTAGKSSPKLSARHKQLSNNSLNSRINSDSDLERLKRNLSSDRVDDSPLASPHSPITVNTHTPRNLAAHMSELDRAILQRREKILSQKDLTQLNG